MAEQKTASRGLLATMALTAGVVVFGVYALDLHSHTCAHCGHRWRHLGAFNLGDAASHTCKKCGQVQWWKCGAPHVLQGSQFAPPHELAGPVCGAELRPLNSAYGHTPPSLPYDQPAYEIPPLGVGAFEETLPWQSAPQSQPRGRLYEEDRPYEEARRSHARPTPRMAYERQPPRPPYETSYASSPALGRGYEEDRAHERSPYEGTSYEEGSYEEAPYERRSYERPPARRVAARSSYEADRAPQRSRRPSPSVSYERPPARPAYERPPSRRAHAALMPGGRDQEEY